MAKITFLGTASAVASKNQQNTHFVFESGDHTILVDCVGNPIASLELAAVDPLAITDLILTHFHPDHVSATPLLLMDMWLMGRTQPLTIHGLQIVIDKLEKMMALFDWEEWRDFYPVNFKPLLTDQPMDLIDEGAIKVSAVPNQHLIPGIGIKVVFPEGSFTYSSDTEPCDAIVQLANGSEVLIHEATGAGKGHSSPEQAGKIAQLAGVNTLYLIHYPPSCESTEWVSRAKTQFQGAVIAAKDFLSVSFS